MKKFFVTEDISGNWHYHISNIKDPYQSLCNKAIMCTGIPLKDWGNKSEHIPESYCNECKKIYDNINKG